MKISIIVPALNEEKYLPTLLESIKEQDYKDYEVIIANSPKSTDRTEEIARTYGAKIVKGGMPSEARNNGAKVAAGDFLFFLDADVFLPKGFLSNAVKEIEERFLDLATCDFVPMSDLRFDKIIHEFTNFFIRLSQFTNTPHSGGACIIVSKRLFNQVGGFNKILTTCEDHDFVQRASVYRPLRVLKSTYINLSIRRLEKEGRLGLIKKYALSEVTSLTKGIIRIPQEYEFAKYENIKTKKFDEALKKLEGNLDKLEEKYKKILNTEIKIDPFERNDSAEERDLIDVRKDLQKEWEEFVSLFKKNDGV